MSIKDDAVDLIRTPAETRPGAHGPAGAVAGVLGARRQARGGRRRQRRGRLEGGAAVGRRRARRCLRRRRRPTSCRRSPAIRRAAPSPSTGAAGRPRILRGAAVAIGAFDDDEERRGFRRRRARGAGAGQCHRQAGVLRFRLRRHRQSFAAGHRHFHRRRRAGVRAGDPRQARSACCRKALPTGPPPPRAGARR